MKIITAAGTGLSLRLLAELSQRDRQGCFARRSGEELANTLGTLGGFGTVTGCVRVARRNVQSRLWKYLGLSCNTYDLTCNDEQGYHLCDWITVRHHSAGLSHAVVTGDKACHGS